MKKRIFEATFVERDENGNIVNTIVSTHYELTPDEGKAFKDPASGELILRPDNTGAVIEIPSELLENYIEYDIEE